MLQGLQAHAPRVRPLLHPPRQADEGEQVRRQAYQRNKKNRSLYVALRSFGAGCPCTSGTLHQGMGLIISYFLIILTDRLFSYYQVAENNVQHV